MTKLFKRILSLVLSVLLVLTAIPIFGTFSFSAEAIESTSQIGRAQTDFGLKFDSNGKFKILQIADIQDCTPVKEATLHTIQLAVEKLEPDLIVLTGDNTQFTGHIATFETTINEFIPLFGDIPFAATFGNHDSEDGPSRQEQFNRYVANGALDFDNNFSDIDLVGVGSGCIPILSSDGSKKVVWNISILDSGTYDDRGGYGKPGYYPNADRSGTCNNEAGYNDVVSWFTNMNEAMKAYTKNGDYAPTLCFQHIPLQEIRTSGIVTNQNGTWVLNASNPTVVGEINEAPCSSASSTKALYKAIADKGNVKGIFYGHDHKNDFMGMGTVNYDGRDYTLVQGYAKGATARSYNDGSQHVRFFELDETSGDYTTESYAKEDLVDKSVFDTGEFDYTSVDYDRTQYVTELATAYSRWGESQAKDFHYKQGYKVLDCNVNEGLPESSDKDTTLSHAAYIGYKTSCNPDGAITGIKFKRQDNNVVADTIVENGITYKIVNTGEDKKLDLNIGNNKGHYDGKYIYTYYTTDIRAGAPITGIHVLSRKNPTTEVDGFAASSTPYSLSAYSTTYQTVATWINEGTIAADLNDGCTDTDRESVYLVYTRDTAPRYIGELGTAYSGTSFDRTKSFINKGGYIPLERNLNEGVNSTTRRVALGYKYTDNYDDAIKAIIFTTANKGASFSGTYKGKTCTWTLVNTGEDPNLNLNTNVSNVSIFTYYTRDAVDSPITGFSVENMLNLTNISYATFEDNTPANLNKGAGGTDLYLGINRDSIVYFDLNGGTGNIPSMALNNGDLLPNIVTSGIANGNSLLQGFYDTKNGGTKYYNADGTPAKSNWDKTTSGTLYAQWVDPCEGGHSLSYSEITELTHTATCSRCGYTAIEAHHFVDGICICGAEEPTVKLVSAALILNGKIDVLFNAQVPQGYSNASMVVNGTSISPSGTNEDGTLRFVYTGITPQCMGDSISATLYATKNGAEESVSVENFSVRQYCIDMLKKEEVTGKLRTLLSDLLAYGAAAQTYTGYKTDALVTSGSDINNPTYSTFVPLSNLGATLSGLAANDTRWTSAALTLTNSVAMNFRFYTDSIENLSVRVTVNGRTQNFTSFTAVDGKEGFYEISFTGISAEEFDDTVTASFYRSGTQVGNTVSYSVNTYVCAKQADPSASLQALVKALYNYGAAVAAYAE